MISNKNIKLLINLIEILYKSFGARFKKQFHHKSRFKTVIRYLNSWNDYTFFLYELFMSFHGAKKT